MLTDRLTILKLQYDKILQECVLCLHGGKSNIQLDGLVQKQANTLSVFTYEAKSVQQNLLGIVQGKFLTFESNMSFRRISTHDTIGDAKLSLAGQTADTKDLTLANFQVDTLYLFAGHIYMEILQFHNNLIRNLSVTGFLTVQSNSTSDHQSGDIYRTGLRDGLGSHVGTITQNGYRIGNTHNLFQTMADKDNADSGISQTTDRLQQILSLCIRQYRGGLIKYQNLNSFLIDLTSDLDKLHMTNRQASYLGVSFDIHIQRLQCFLCIRIHLLIIQSLQTLTQYAAYHVGLRDLPVQLNILGNSKAGNQHEFLMHHSDTCKHGIVGRFDVHLFAFDFNRTIETTGLVDNGHTE